MPPLLVLVFLTATAALECLSKYGPQQCGTDINEAETSFCTTTYYPNGTVAYTGCNYAASCEKVGCTWGGDWVVCCSENATIPLPPPSMTQNWISTTTEMPDSTALSESTTAVTSAVATSGGLWCPSHHGEPGTFQCPQNVTLCARSYYPNGTEHYRGCDFDPKWCEKVGCSIWQYSGNSDYVLCCSENATIPLPPTSMTLNWISTTTEMPASTTTESTSRASSGAALECPYMHGPPHACPCDADSYETFCLSTYSPNGTAMHSGCDISAVCKKTGCMIWWDTLILCCSENATIPAPPPSMFAHFTTTTDTTTSTSTPTSEETATVTMEMMTSTAIASDTTIAASAALECPTLYGLTQCSQDINYCDTYYWPNGRERYTGCDEAKFCEEVGCSVMSDGDILCCSENATIPLPPPSMFSQLSTTTSPSTLLMEQTTSEATTMMASPDATTSEKRTTSTTSSTLSTTEATTTTSTATSTWTTATTSSVPPSTTTTTTTIPTTTTSTTSTTGTVPTSTTQPATTTTTVRATRTTATTTKSEEPVTPTTSTVVSTDALDGTSSERPGESSDPEYGALTTSSNTTIEGVERSGESSGSPGASGATTVVVVAASVAMAMITN